MAEIDPKTFKHISAKPFAPNLGAEISGVDLSQPISNAEFAEIEAAFLAYQVLFFKNQREIPPQVHIDFGKRFGSLHSHPAAPAMAGYPEIFEIHATRHSKVANGEFWHSDVSCDEEPPLGTMLQIHILPPCGCDTMFSNMYAAYDALSDAMKQFLIGLNATHSSDHIYCGCYTDRGQKDSNITFPNNSHPVVRTHP